MPSLRDALRPFARIYVITLRSTPERQARMRALLDGVDFEFVYGSDRRDFTLDDLERRGVISTPLIIKNHLQGMTLKPGMIGCSLSHRSLYEQVAASTSGALILEDDLEVRPEGIDAFGAAMRELPPNWELLYLDYWQPDQPTPKQRLVQVKHAAQAAVGRFPLSIGAIRRRFAVPFSSQLLRPGYFFYTSAYAVTPSAARTLLRLQTPVAYAPDHLLAKACTERLVNAFAVKQRVFEQYSMKTGESLTG